MFNVGDRVVYPMYGAGVIEGIETRDVDGQELSYYVLHIPIGDLKILISKSKADVLGLRALNSAEEVIDIVNNAEPIDMSNNWNLRYKENMAKLKTGDLFKITQVFKTLFLRERVKSLSSIEKKLLGTAKQIILSEILLSQDTDKSHAEELLMHGIAIPIK